MRPPDRPAPLRGFDFWFALVALHLMAALMVLCTAGHAALAWQTGDPFHVLMALMFLGLSAYGGYAAGCVLALREKGERR